MSMLHSYVIYIINLLLLITFVFSLFFFFFKQKTAYEMRISDWSSDVCSSDLAGHTDVQEIEQAYALLSPMLGVGIASTLFAVALLASGLNSTVTATLAGQIVMEGFLHLRMPTWARRLVTRGIAIVPVVIITGLYGSEGTAKLLVFSQVLLSMQLPFAVIPLVRFVTDREKMGRFVIAPWLASLAWVIASVIVV